MIDIMETSTEAESWQKQYEAHISRVESLHNGVSDYSSITWMQDLPRKTPDDTWSIGAPISLMGNVLSVRK